MSESQYPKYILVDENNNQLAFVNGKLPVDISSLSITLSDTELTIVNDVNNPVPVTGTVSANTGLTQPLTNTQLRSSSIAINDDGNSLTVDGTVTANIGTLNGIATESTLSGINGKIPSLGQTLSSGSVPVVLPASQITTLTPPSSIGISGTLPAFTTTPTFNIGTIGTIATETTLNTLNGKIPSNLTVNSTRLLVDNSGVTQPVSGTVTAISPQGLSYESIGANITANIKSGSTVLYSLTCTNLNSTIRYLQLFNSTGSTTGTPIRSFPVYGSSGFLVIGNEVFGTSGLSFSTGLTFAFSTTPLTYTAGVATDCIFSARYQ